MQAPICRGRLGSPRDRVCPCLHSAAISLSNPGFSPDDRTLAEAGMETAVRLWHLNPDDNVQTICAATAPALTPDFWNRYLNGLTFDPPCN